MNRHSRRFYCTESETTCYHLHRLTPAQLMRDLVASQQIEILVGEREPVTHGSASVAPMQGQSRPGAMHRLRPEGQHPLVRLVLVLTVGVVDDVGFVSNWLFL